MICGIPTLAIWFQRVSRFSRSENFWATRSPALPNGTPTSLNARNATPLKSLERFSAMRKKPSKNSRQTAGTGAPLSHSQVLLAVIEKRSADQLAIYREMHGLLRRIKKRGKDNPD